MTKVDIISGFLGAGKTTLIQRLLQEAFHQEQVVLIENEFGEIGIDSGFLKNSGIEIKEMNSGCICCSLVGDFQTSLQEVIDTYQPDRVIIEPSGVGKLSDVRKAVEDVGRSCDLEIHGYTTVVDVTKCKMYLRNMGEFFADQLEYADTIILSRTDKADAKKVEQAVELIREHNEKAHIVTTPIAELGGAKVLEVIEGAVRPLEMEACSDEEHNSHGDGCCHEGHHHDHSEGCCHEEHHHDHEEGCCHEEHHHDGECDCHDHHHADEVFSSWGKETTKAFYKSELERILDKLSDQTSYGIVLRAKGIVQGESGGWYYFDMVPGEVEVREGSPEFTGRLCVIGSELKMEKIEDLFLMSSE